MKPDPNRKNSEVKNALSSKNPIKRATVFINSEFYKVTCGMSVVKLDGGKRKTRCQTLVPADIDPELGIQARSFDTTIESINRIQEEIVWGEE